MANFFPMTLPSIIIEPRDHILFLGDSITHRGSRRDGFVQLIKSVFAGTPGFDSVQFSEKGVSGNRVPDLQKRLKRDVLRHRPTLIVLYIGTNDVWHSRSGRGTEASVYRSGLDDLITRIIQGGARILLCTPAVIGERYDGTNDFDILLDQYCQISRDIARMHNVPLLDLRSHFLGHLKCVNQGNADKGILTLDGVHLNSDGNTLVAKRMLEAFSLKN